MLRKKQAAAVVEPPPTPLEIGRDKTVKELREANATAKRQMEGAYDRYHWGAGDQRELQRGAIQGFLKGSVENLQTILSNPEEFAIIDYDNKMENVNYKTKTILFELTEGRGDLAAAIIDLALDKVFDSAKKQELLDNTLYQAISGNPYPGEEAFIAALLKAGAKANVEVDGSAGRTLAVAITYGHPPRVIKLLSDNGGPSSFHDAEIRIRTKAFWDDKRETCLEKLKVYRQEITGEPATIEVKPELLQELQQTIKELTKKVDQLSPQAPASAASKPATAKVQRFQQNLRILP